MDLKPVVLAGLLLIGLNACTAHPAATNNSPAAAPAAAPTRRALLIGVDKYPYVNQLNGCVNDVKAMKQLLVTKFGFPEQQVNTLEDEQATRKAILTGLHVLIAASGPNDVVVIHYSGHGSQIADPSGAEVDGLDETIIPYDYQNVEGGKYPITDKQIAGALAELSGKTKNITIILDCCHSGGGTKGLGLGVRMISMDKRKALLNDDFLLQGRSPDKNGQLKNDHSAYVLLAGCRSDQVSYEMGIAQGVYHGIFSYYLINELQNSGGNMSWQEVMENVRTHVRTTHADQSPQLEGMNKNSFVFGDNYVQKRPYVTVQPSGDHLVTLDGGLIYGFTVGSAFDIFPKGKLDFNSGKIASVVITRVSAFQAEARVVSGTVKEANSRGVETKHVFDRSVLLVRFLGANNPSFEAIKGNLLRIEGIGADNLHPDLTFYRRVNRLFIYAGRDTSDALESVDLAAPGAEQSARAAAMAWLNWFRVVKVDNHNLSLPITVTVTLDPTEKSINLNAPDYIFKDNTKALLVIKNLSRVPLFIYVVDLQDDGSIDVFTASQFKDEGKTSNEPLAPGATFTGPFAVQNNGSKKVSRDVMKVIATTTDVDFDLLKQKRGSATKDILPGQTALSVSAQWTSADRVIFAEKQ